MYNQIRNTSTVLVSQHDYQWFQSWEDTGPEQFGYLTPPICFCGPYTEITAQLVNIWNLVECITMFLTVCGCKTE